MLISIEGIDGSGKSTLVQKIAQELHKMGYETLLTKEPGGSSLGKTLRNCLQNRTFAMCPEAEFLLFASDRAQHMREIIEPALIQGKVVISDRMADSSLAYQGFGRKLDIDFINKVNVFALNNRIPDLTIYIKIDVGTAFNRIAIRNEKLTAFEQEKKDFFQRVSDGFDTIFANRDNVLILDGNLEQDVLLGQSIKYIGQKYANK